MAGWNPPGLGEDFQAGPVARAIAPAGQIGGERIARLLQLGAASAPGDRLLFKIHLRILSR